MEIQRTQLGLVRVLLRYNCARKNKNTNTIKQKKKKNLSRSIDFRCLGAQIAVLHRRQRTTLIYARTVINHKYYKREVTQTADS